MKFCITILLLTIASFTKAQQNIIVGKWKPIYFSLGGLVTGDLSKDAPETNISLDSLVQNDKDPQASKDMMMMFFQILFDKTKNQQEEYSSNASFTETDLKTGKLKKGTYSYNETKHELIKIFDGLTKKYVFAVQFINDSLILSSPLRAVAGKEATFSVTFTKQ